MKSIMSILLITGLGFHGVCANLETGEIRGTVTNKENGQPVPFASVAIIKNETIIASTMADDKGAYKIKPVPAGEYTMQASFVEFNKTTISGVLVEANRITFQDISISQKELPVVIVRGEKLIQKDQTMTITTFNSLDIKQSPYRSPQEFATTVPGVVQREEGGSFNIRGSRSSDTQYIVDGIKIIGGLSIPRSAIASMSVITGGVPAMYGDATGGIIVITTKGYAGTY